MFYQGRLDKYYNHRQFSGPSGLMKTKKKKRENFYDSTNLLFQNLEKQRLDAFPNQTLNPLNGQKDFPRKLKCRDWKGTALQERYINKPDYQCLASISSPLEPTSEGES